MPINKTAPPRRTTPRTGTVKPEPAPANPQHASRKEGVEGIGQLLVAMFLLRGNFADAMAFQQHGAKVAEEAASIADHNEQLAKILDYLAPVGPYQGLFMAIMPLVMQLLVNHNKVPVEAAAQFGVVPPDMLAMLGKVELEKTKTATLLAIKQAQDDAAKMQTELGTNIAT